MPIEYQKKLTYSVAEVSRITGLRPEVVKQMFPPDKVSGYEDLRIRLAVLERVLAEQEKESPQEETP